MRLTFIFKDKKFYVQKKLAISLLVSLLVLPTFAIAEEMHIGGGGSIANIPNQLIQIANQESQLTKQDEQIKIENKIDKSTAATSDSLTTDHTEAKTLKKTYDDFLLTDTDFPKVKDQYTGKPDELRKAVTAFITNKYQNTQKSIETEIKELTTKQDNAKGALSIAQVQTAVARLQMISAQNENSFGKFKFEAEKEAERIQENFKTANRNNYISARTGTSRTLDDFDASVFSLKNRNRQKQNKY